MKFFNNEIENVSKQPINLGKLKMELYKNEP